MRIAFHYSTKPREIALAHAFVKGAIRHGHEVELRRLGKGARVGECDIACMVGVKSAQLWNETKAAGALPLMFDKGYIRDRAGYKTWKYWRLSLGDHHPTSTTLNIKMPYDRFEGWGRDPRPWKEPFGEILIAGSSEKYHNFMGLPHPTKWVSDLVDEIRTVSSRPIVYRPKPSWKGAVEIPGTEFSGSKDKFSVRLRQSYALVTHGSNACFDAIMEGTPAVILGNAVSKSISSNTVSGVRDPLRCSDSAKLQWLSNLAYHQWTEGEMESGECFETVREWLRCKFKF